MFFYGYSVSSKTIAVYLDIVTNDFYALNQQYGLDYRKRIKSLEIIMTGFSPKKHFI